VLFFFSSFSAGKENKTCQPGLYKAGGEGQWREIRRADFENYIKTAIELDYDTCYTYGS
jgi:hypothetical protein